MRGIYLAKTDIPIVPINSYGSYVAVFVFKDITNIIFHDCAFPANGQALRQCIQIAVNTSTALRRCLRSRLHTAYLGILLIIASVICIDNGFMFHLLL